MKPGTLLYDPATDKVGEYQDRSGPYTLLRPVGGGREWQVDPAALRPATDQERLSAEVRAANDRTRTAVPPPDPDGPPQPVAGCSVCAELAGLRAAARAVYDRSAETDTNVLLRQHRGEAHPA